MPRLAEQTLGIVGFGRIARALVPRARGFGLRVLVYTPRLAVAGAVPGELAAEVEVAASLDELLAAADYVSLHVPATTQSAGLIGERELAQMKPTGYLINTSRGALIDEDALARALARTARSPAPRSTCCRASPRRPTCRCLARRT